MVKPLQNINISTNSGFKFLSELSSPPGVQEAVMGASWPGSPSPGPWNSSRSSTTAGVLALDDDARCPMPDASVTHAAVFGAAALKVGSKMAKGSIWSQRSGWKSCSERETGGVTTYNQILCRANSSSFFFSCRANS